MDFVATQWSSVREKEEFASRFIKFVESGFKKSFFTKKFYTRLSMCFGHIAHYDKDGFWAEWFTTPEDQKRFMEKTITYGCYGDPEYTFSDVEKYLVKYFKEHSHETASGGITQKQLQNLLQKLLNSESLLRGIVTAGSYLIEIASIEEGGSAVPIPE